jgi:hypothetical protein
VPPQRGRGGAAAFQYNQVTAKRFLPSVARHDDSVRDLERSILPGAVVFDGHAESRDRIAFLAAPAHLHDRLGATEPAPALTGPKAVNDYPPAASAMDAQTVVLAQIAQPKIAHFENVS